MYWAALLSSLRTFSVSRRASAASYVAPRFLYSSATAATLPAACSEASLKNTSCRMFACSSDALMAFRFSRTPTAIAAGSHSDSGAVKYPSPTSSFHVLAMSMTYSAGYSPSPSWICSPKSCR